MRIAIVADTHIPSRVPAIPSWVEEVIRNVDHTIHAGDFDSPEGHFELSVLAGGEMTAVIGNMDPGLGYPEVSTLEVEGVRFVVTHGDGHRSEHAYKHHLRDLARRRNADVAIAGHTHRVMDTVDDGVRLLNPGSATGADPASEATLMTAECRDGSLAVRLHRGQAA